MRTDTTRTRNGHSAFAPGPHRKRPGLIMVLLSKRESHLGSKRAIDDKRKAEDAGARKLRKNNPSLSAISHAVLWGAIRSLSSTLRSMEGEIRIENCLRSARRCHNLRAR